MEYLNVFIWGGAICALVQLLMERTKLMPGRIMVLLVCSGALLHFFGLFETMEEMAAAGLTVPLLGFGKLLMEGVFQGIEKDGILGIFSGGLSASSIGITATMVFSYLASFLFSSHMKK